MLDGYFRKDVILEDHVFDLLGEGRNRSATHSAAENIF